MFSYGLRYGISNEYSYLICRQDIDIGAKFMWKILDVFFGWFYNYMTLYIFIEIVNIFPAHTGAVSSRVSDVIHRLQYLPAATAGDLGGAVPHARRRGHCLQFHTQTSHILCFHG